MRLLSNIKFQGTGVALITPFKKNNEIDFVATKNGEEVYIQVCYLIQDQSTHDREFGNLLQINNQFPKFVLSMDAPDHSNTFKGIVHKSISDFLLTFK